MSSREIAELVNSRHDKVKQSIERLAERGVITLPPMGEVSNDGPGPKSVKVYIWSASVTATALSRRYRRNHAAIRAGYTERSAEVQASTLLRLPKVQAALVEAQKRRFQRVEITQDRELHEVARLTPAQPGGSVEIC